MQPPLPPPQDQPVVNPVGNWTRCTWFALAPGTHDFQNVSCQVLYDGLRVAISDFPRDVTQRCGASSNLLEYIPTPDPTTALTSLIEPFGTGSRTVTVHVTGGPCIITFYSMCQEALTNIEGPETFTADPSDNADLQSMGFVRQYWLPNDGSVFLLNVNFQPLPGHSGWSAAIGMGFNN